MNKRIKEIRRRAGLTQEEFGKRLGIKRNTVATYEIGRNQPIDAVISLICREFNINEEWLRTGQGEMTYAKGRNQIVSEFAADLIKEPESFKTRLIESLAKLDEKDWIELEKIFDKLTRD